jgi:hypothetical protein
MPDPSTPQDRTAFRSELRKAAYDLPSPPAVTDLATAAPASPRQPYRVLVTGSRDWPAAGRIRSELSALADQHPEGLIVIHGDARSGADRMASDWARRERNAGRRVTEETHPANWQRHGGHSGLLRNAEMVALGADLCLAWIMPCVKPYCRRPDPHGSHGATHCADLAEKAGIPVIRNAEYERYAYRASC